MTKRVTAPYTFYVYRAIVTLLVFVPIGLLVLALFGVGPLTELVSGPKFAVKLWIANCTGLWL